MRRAIRDAHVLRDPRERRSRRRRIASGCASSSTSGGRREPALLSRLLDERAARARPRDRAGRLAVAAPVAAVAPALPEQHAAAERRAVSLAAARRRGTHGALRQAGRTPSRSDFPDSRDDVRGRALRVRARDRRRGGERGDRRTTRRRPSSGAGATSRYEQSAAVRAGALLLERTMPERRAGVHALLPRRRAGRAPRRRSTAAFTTTFAIPDAMRDAIARQLDVILGGHLTARAPAYVIFRACPPTGPSRQPSSHDRSRRGRARAGARARAAGRARRWTRTADRSPRRSCSSWRRRSGSTP